MIYCIDMKANSHTQINGHNVVLVPYMKHHVLRYHEWMKDPVLQEQTASEPLTLEQEYEMQKSWHDDEKKCTFIVLDAAMYNETKEDEERSMIGDVNLFLNDEDDPQSAEVEVMIAEKHCRGKGCGKEAVLAMLFYGIKELNMSNYTAKIGFSNEVSLSMFQKLGFSEVSRSEVFKEISLRLSISEDKKGSIIEESQYFKLSDIGVR